MVYIKQVCILNLIIATIFCRVLHRRSQLRVRFGVDDTDNKYPYVVCLVDKRFRTCTGTLITSNWVLSAAHCNVCSHIRYGNMTIPPKKSKSYSKILKAVPHPGARPEPEIVDACYLHPNTFLCTMALQNDIAMFLVEKVPINIFPALSALNFEAAMGHAVEYAGFGDIHGTSKDPREKEKELLRVPLQIGEGMVVPCEGRTESEIGFLCVAPKCSNRSQLTMPGDSGGPLFHDGKIAAVLTGGDPYDLVNMYTPVSPYLEWIHDVMIRENSTEHK